MGQRRKKGARVLGPYKHHSGGYSVVVVAEDGGRAAQIRPTEEEALELVRAVEAELELDGPVTVQTALDRYEVEKRSAGTSAASIKTTMFRLRSLLAGVAGQRLSRLTPERCGALYGELVARQAVDTHRNALAETKTWARWCVRRRLLRFSPWEHVEPLGKRKQGKEQLRLDEARRWLAAALELAPGDDGAVAAMCCLLLGCRPGEVVARVGRDVDDEGRLLWIPASKSAAGRRAVEVPAILQPHLLRLAEERGLAGRLWPHQRPWVLDQVRRVCRVAGVTEVTAHGLRGTQASLAMRSGTAAHAVAATLGHASPMQTLAAYAQPEAVAAARQERFLGLLGAGSGERLVKKSEAAMDGQVQAASSAAN